MNRGAAMNTRRPSYLILSRLPSAFADPTPTERSLTWAYSLATVGQLSRHEFGSDGHSQNRVHFHESRILC